MPLFLNSLSFLNGNSNLRDLLNLSGKLRCRAGHNVESIPPGRGVCWCRSRVVGRGGLVHRSGLVDGSGIVSRDRGIDWSRLVGSRGGDIKFKYKLGQ